MTENERVIKNQSNPVKNGERITISIKNARGNYTSKIHDISGRLMAETSGTIQEINQNINLQFRSLDKGTYLISLSNNNEKYTVKVMKE